MNINEMSITELKALAYDTRSVLERANQNLTVINQQIAKLLTESKMENEEVVATEATEETVAEETSTAEVAEEVAPEAE